MQWSNPYILHMKWSSQYGTTTFARNFLVSRPCLIRYSMFVTFMLLKFLFLSQSNTRGVEQFRGPLLLLQYSLYRALFARDLWSVYSIQKLLTHQTSSCVKNWPGPKLACCRPSSDPIHTNDLWTASGKTTYALNILVSRPDLIRYSMLVTILLLKFLFWSRRDKKGANCVGFFYCFNAHCIGPFFRLFARDLCSVYSIQKLLTNQTSSCVKNWPGPKLAVPAMQWSNPYIWLMSYEAGGGGAGRVFVSTGVMESYSIQHTDVKVVTNLCCLLINRKKEEKKRS